MCFIGTCLKNIKSEQSRHFFGVFDSELAKKKKKTLKISLSSSLALYRKTDMSKLLQ